MSPATPPRRAARGRRPLAITPLPVRLFGLFISGYPPEDLVLKPALQAACRAKIEELSA